MIKEQVEIILCEYKLEMFDLDKGVQLLNSSYITHFIELIDEEIEINNNVISKFVELGGEQDVGYCARLKERSVALKSLKSELKSGGGK